MSVKVRPYRRGGWEVDIRLRLPNGRRYRERSRRAVTSRTAAQPDGARAVNGILLLHGRNQERAKEVPTLEEFATRFVDGAREWPIDRNRAASQPRRRSSECISCRARVEASGRDHATRTCSG